MLHLAQMLRFAVESRASDLHISAGEAPMLRVDGDMRRIDFPALTREEAHGLIFDVMNDSQRRTFQEHLEVDFSFALDTELRFRVNAFMQNRGEAAVFRSIPYKIPKISDLGLPQVVHNFCRANRGLVLVTGPTGSGKSTTLASMIDLINTTEAGHILTLEDPIEFVHTPKRCMVNQREIGPMSHSFSAALRSALREDPDIILVGEMRDLETIALALTAAETGHLVFGTLHTASAPKTIDRIIDAFPQTQQAQIRAMLAESLVGVVAQKLLKRKGGGRVAALEIMVGTPAVRNLIRENKSFQLTSVIQAGARFGMQCMDAAIQTLEQRQLITPEEARAYLGVTEGAAATS